MNRRLSLAPFSGSNFASNPVDIFRAYIGDELARVSGIARETIIPCLEWTNQSDRGDLVLPVPRLRAKGKPDELATTWAAQIECGKYLQQVLARGAFLQFYFAHRFLLGHVTRDILLRTTAFGRVDSVGAGKRVVVEFSSTNIAKPFHAGHLRSTIIGGFLANLHETLGWHVTRVNYLGDWGKQFGVLAVGYKRFGDAQALQNDPINHLYDVYVKINKVMETDPDTDAEARDFFRQMEAGDPAALELWRTFRELSIAKYKKTYARLNINYDVYSGESQVSPELMRHVISDLESRGLLEEDKGAKLVDLARLGHKKLGKTIVEKSDGTTLYVTRDLGEAIQRHEKYAFDKMIYVVASQQDLHMAQFFKILQLLGHEWAAKMVHVSFGLVQGMSTRKGTVVFLDDILEETKNKIHEVMRRNEKKYALVPDPDHVADLVGISAVMIQDMQSKRVNSYKFDWARMLSFEGDTGPYLQYAHSRLRSVERNAADAVSRDQMLSADMALITEPVAVDLVRCLAQYPDTLVNAAKTLEPSTVVTYLFKLTHLVSSCYDVLWVANQPPELAAARLAVYSSARWVLYNGMVVLGLTPVERM